MTIGLTALASTAHALPFGLNDAPDHAAGVITLIGMLLMYLCLALLQWRPQTLTIFRRWSYAGFYLDELATRMALTLWPTRWMPVSPRGTQSALNNQSAVTGSN